MSEETVAELIGRYNRAWNEQDLDTVMAMHTEDVVFHNHTAGERVEGTDEVRAHIASIFERYPDLRFEDRALYAAGDFAASEWTARATLADGRVAEWDGVDLFPLRDRLIARKDVYSSSATPRILGG